MAQVNDDLPFTGERFVPGTRGEIWVEHWHRYHFAARWAAGKRVLDVACGEGYGSALLARHAARVTGIDLSPQAVAHAQKTYAALGNAQFVCAPCQRLPLPDASIDLAVSFETIEHITEQAAFLDELARVLTPEGVLVLSCPNKLEYSDKRGFVNEFHVKELYREELEALLAARFPAAEWYGQRPTFFSLIAPDAESRAKVEAHLAEVSESAPDQASSRLSHPLYFLALCSRAPASLAALPPTLSVLADRDDWVHQDYEKVMRYQEYNAAHAKALEAQLEAHAAEMARLVKDAADLRTAISLQEAALAAQKALVEASTAAHAAELAAKDAELLRRRGWRWWLKLPFIRLGIIRR
jgi:ubiquinone/menaquinone biosynthesis C-methylase UbiE